MYLSAYRFAGDPATLTAAHDALFAAFPTESLHVCAQNAEGIVVLDTCPSQAVFESFSRSPEFRAAMAASGLPQPTIEPLGEICFVAPGLTAQAVGPISEEGSR